MRETKLGRIFKILLKLLHWNASKRVRFTFNNHMDSNAYITLDVMHALKICNFRSGLKCACDHNLRSTRNMDRPSLTLRINSRVARPSQVIKPPKYTISFFYSSGVLLGLVILGQGQVRTRKRGPMMSTELII